MRHLSLTTIFILLLSLTLIHCGDQNARSDSNQATDDTSGLTSGNQKGFASSDESDDSSESGDDLSGIAESSSNNESSNRETASSSESNDKPVYRAPTPVPSNSSSSDNSSKSFSTSGNSIMQSSKTTTSYFYTNDAMVGPPSQLQPAPPMTKR